MQMFCCCSPRRNGQGHGANVDTTVCSQTSANLLTMTTKRLRLPRARAKDELPSDEVSPFEGPLELCQLTSNGHDVAEAASDIPSTNQAPALSGVKARLSKQLFHEAGLRRQSRVSIGHSDEELARRAEVRRLRQQRIQDELDKEGGDDGCSDKSHRSTHYLSPMIDMGSPGSGPRDTIEFTFESCCAGSNSTSSELSFCPITVTTAEGNTEPSQNLQMELESSARSLVPQSKDEIASQARSQSAAGSPSVRCISPLAMPQRPSSCAPSTASLNRILGLDNEFNIRHGSHAWEDQSALGIWLIAQGMRSNNSSALQSDACDVTTTPTNRESLLPPGDLGGVDSIIDSSKSHIRDVQATVGSALKAGDEKSQSLPGNVQSQSSACPPVHDLRDEPVGSSTTDSSSCLNAPKSTAVDANGNGSSNYPSVLPSFQPSPAASQKGGYILSQKDLENLDFSSFQWYANLSSMRNLGYSEGKSSYATAEEHSPSTSKSCDLHTPSNRKMTPGQIKGDESLPSLSVKVKGGQLPREVTSHTQKQRNSDISQRDSQPNDDQQPKTQSEHVSSLPRHISFRTRIQQSLSNLSKSSSIASNKKWVPEASSLIGGVDTTAAGSTTGIDENSFQRLH